MTTTGETATSTTGTATGRLRSRVRRRLAQAMVAMVLATGIGVVAAPPASAAPNLTPPQCNGLVQKRFDWGWVLWTGWRAKSYSGRIYYEYTVTHYPILGEGGDVSYGSCWA
ncbi:hypothetical protein ACFUMH_18175 [Cellulomonas sp. NPDC057328]|uniref:hypothetical protein n=1 Tax=Cellulomonas sp. NPDC057328 TaxID=3346101 RepID=UPI0036453AA2